MSHTVAKITRGVLFRSNNAQLKKLQHTGIYKAVRTLSYGLRINRRRK